MSETHPSDLVDKYLIFLSNIKTSSAHTLAAYRRDLAQAFGVQRAETSKKRGPSQPGVRAALETLSTQESALLSLAHDAMHAWSELSPASRNRKVAVLKAFFRWLFENGFTQNALGERLRTPKVPQKVPRVLALEEIQALMKAIGGLEGPSRAQAQTLFLLLYGCGLRVSEAIRAKGQDLSTNVLRIRGKGGRERLVPIPSPMVLSLKNLGPGLLVRPEIHERQAYELIRKLGARAGLLKPIHPHALRHSYATHLLASGSDLRVLQELLGHESLAATQRYTHLNVDHLARTLESFHPLSKKGE